MKRLVTHTDFLDPREQEWRGRRFLNARARFAFPGVMRARSALPCSAAGRNG
jgi:hypothetical protein